MIKNKQGEMLAYTKYIVPIKRYVDEGLYDSAVMIDGEWGSGKTYFVKKILQEALIEHEKAKREKNSDYEERAILYISLYGIKSIEEISKQIFMDTYLGQNEIGKKGSSILSSMAPLAFEIAKNVGLDLQKSSVEKAIMSIFSRKNIILIFDDLERCDCPINEVLGYINTFVEHEHIKVILVANQKEIGRNISERNKELKHLVAISDKILFKHEDKEQQELLLSTEDINKRISILFDQNEGYKKIKEKLIGITLYYYPDFDMIIPKLIKAGIKDNYLKNCLLENKDLFIEYMSKIKHLNLRTFQFYLSKIKDIYSGGNEWDTEVQKRFFKHIVHYSFRVAVTYKSGHYEYPWESLEKCGNVSLNSDHWSGNTLGFRFVDDFITNSLLSKQEIQDSLITYKKNYHKDDKGKKTTLEDLTDKWPMLNDDDIRRYLNYILKELEDDYYGFNRYAQVLMLILKLLSIGFEDNFLEKAIKYMKKNVSTLREHRIITEIFSPSDDEDLNKKTRDIMQQLQTIIDNAFKNNAVDNIAKLIECEDVWGNKLYAYINENSREIRQNIGFLMHIDISEVTKKLYKSSEADIVYFRRCIYSLYKGQYGFFESEQEHLKELLILLKEMKLEKFGLNKKHQLRLLISHIENIFESYINFDTLLNSEIINHSTGVMMGETTNFSENISES